jgi:hypothetical protein
MIPDPAAPALRQLRRTLVRRRLRRLDPRLRVEIAVLALIVGSFLFWQFRIRYAGLAAAHGPTGTAFDFALLLVALALAGGVTSGVRHLLLLRRRARGPVWLALPLSPGLLSHHLAWESRTGALVLALPVPAALIAAVGLAPLPWLLLLAAAFVWLLLEFGRAGCAAAEWAAAIGIRAGTGARITSLLSVAAVTSPAGRRPRPRWGRSSPAVALWRKDLLLVRRSARVRSRLVPAVGFAALSVALWGLPGLGPAAPPLALGLALIASGSFGEWILSLGGEDPFAIVRGLPVHWRAVWGARGVWVVSFAALLLVAHGAAARPLAPEARTFFLLWLGAACLAIGALAVNYSVTLFPRADHAQRVYGLSLGIAVVGSLLIPLLGWIVLLTAIAHSALRLPHWTQLEESA